jgi:hypothetical protein
MEWARHWTSDSPPLVTAARYSKFMQLLYSALYAFSPQGRQSGNLMRCVVYLETFQYIIVYNWCCVGVQDLKFRQAEELISQGHSLTTKFKTAATYGYQPVSLSKISLELFRIYLSSFRPFVSGGKCDRPDDSLWLRLDGNPEIGIGRYVKMFYSSACNLHITTTRMRSLTETVANDLHEVILVL